MGESTETDRNRVPVVVGLVTAVGTPLDVIEEALDEYLRQANHSVTRIEIIDELAKLRRLPSRIGMLEDDRIKAEREACRDFRRRLGRDDALAMLAIRAIKEFEQVKNPDRRPRRAYVIRSLKHPDEVRALRAAFGDAFILIAATESNISRINSLSKRIAVSEGRRWSQEYHRRAIKLADEDRGSAEPHGPRVQHTFHRADVFVPIGNRKETRRIVRRFVRLIFGDILETPTRDELSMFFADAAALRSGFLSRQVGAVIVEPDRGSIIAAGCNDVPVFGGGLYWPDAHLDERDCARGEDRSFPMKEHLVEDVIGRLYRAGWFAVPEILKEPGGRPASGKRVHRQNVARLLELALRADSAPLADSEVMDVLEYHRAVHAEMTAITDAARRGVAIQGAHLYTTTFPCHVCAKHIVAAGINRVIYIEPYPRSHAEDLHDDAISVDPVNAPANRLNFVPFIGVAPRRFRQVFGVNPGERRTPGSGAGVPRGRWMDGMPRWERVGELFPTADAVWLNAKQALSEFERQIRQLANGGAG